MVLAMKRLALIVALAGCGMQEQENVPPPDVTVSPAPAEALNVDAEQHQEQPLTGFPCDVRAVLEANCAHCHLGQTYAPALATRDVFLQQSVQNQTMGAHAVQLMAQNQMPPYGATPRPSNADADIIATWVRNGMPGGSCGALTAP
jgi:mono/diheme cytochrome c family protein